MRAKADTSPVTEADEAADALISAGLRAAFPGVALVTEEQAASHAQSGATFLIVDPLDGTKEFVQRRGDFTVNIAYVENGVPSARRGLCAGQGAAVLHPARTAGRSRRPGRMRPPQRPDPADRRVGARQSGADGGGVEIAPRSGDR